MFKRLTQWVVASMGLIASLPIHATDRVPAFDDARRCDALANLQIDKGSVTKSTYTVDASSFQAGLGVTSMNSDEAIVPPVPFCRVEITVTPAAEADIKIEVWLPPVAKWNRHFFGTGNGGAAGRIVYTALVSGVARGFAVANTDVGSHPSDAGAGAFRFGLDRPELVTNYVHRGIHTMSVVGKQVTKAYYQKAPDKAIFAGCSGGGYEAIGEALRYPEDYDGIISGDPAINFANVGLYQGYSYAVTHKTSRSAIPAEKLPMLAEAALAQCDALDGLSDGLIDDPRRCRLDVHRLQCKAGEATNCLNEDQVAAVSALYEGLRDPRNGKLIYPGFPPGAELSGGAKVRIANLNTGSLINSDTPAALIWVLGPSWNASNWLNFDFGEQADAVREQMKPFENATPDLRAFRARGGRFILYSGWADPNLNPYDIVDFFETMQKSTGDAAQAHQFSRLFMVPGMYHCAGGPGPSYFGQALVQTGSSADDDLILAMDRWVAHGIAPERIVATKFKDDKPTQAIERTRPLCAYPKVARWNGVGSIDKASNFTCLTPIVEPRSAIDDIQQGAVGATQLAT